MAFRDWTFVGYGTGALDDTIKYSGASSFKAHMTNDGASSLTHNTFSEPKAQIILWVRNDNDRPLDRINHTRNYVSLSSYGDLPMYGYMGYRVWTKFRLSFWYDLDLNTRFGRIEKWVTSSWVQQGDDINFGTGSPATGTLSLKTAIRVSFPGTDWGSAWFDEVEVYS